jgi:hypothetical protein
MASVQVGKPAINRIGLTVQDGSRHGQLATSTSVARHRTRTSGPPSRAERHLGVRPADHPAWTGEGQAGSPAPPIGTVRDLTRSSLGRRTPTHDLACASPPRNRVGTPRAASTWPHLGIRSGDATASPTHHVPGRDLLTYARSTLEVGSTRLPSHNGLGCQCWEVTLLR